jgi:hypothetical protein
VAGWRAALPRAILVAMPTRRAVLAAVPVLALVAACADDGSVAGTYELDTAAFREAMRATVTPAMKADAARMEQFEAAVQQSRVTITLAPDGRATVVTRGVEGASTETGTWGLDADTITLTTRDEAGKQSVRRGQRAGATLTIADEMVAGDPVRMTFTKQ